MSLEMAYMLVGMASFAFSGWLTRRAWQFLERAQKIHENCRGPK